MGRNDEEDEIIKILSKNHRVLINGVGGIGKTALAKKIYFDYESKYKHIAWIEFKSSWAESLISSLFTVNFNFSEKNTEDEKYEKIFQFLSNLKGNQNDTDESKLILAELYNNYSKVYSMESDIPMAIKMAQHAESLIDSINNDCSPNYYFQKMIIKKTVGMHFAHLKNNEEALEKLREAIKISNNVNESQKHQIANLYSDYSLLLYDTGDICDSINTYRKVIQLYDECGITKYSPWRNTTYTNYADSLILNSQYEDAIYYEFQALIGKYNCYNEDNLAIANALLGMGHIYRTEKRLWDIAAVFYSKAADIYKMVSSVCDGYCDSIACLAMVTDSHELPLMIYEIIMSNTTKVYLISTMVNVMYSLKEFYPDKMILVGEKVIDMLKSFEKGHVAEQLIYALMGETYYKLDKKMKAKECLLKSINKRMIPTSYYYKESIKILSKIPSMIDETALGD